MSTTQELINSLDKSGKFNEDELLDVITQSKEHDDPAAYLDRIYRERCQSDTADDESTDSGKIDIVEITVQKKHRKVRDKSTGGLVWQFRQDTVGYSLRQYRQGKPWFAGTDLMWHRSPHQIVGPWETREKAQAGIAIHDAWQRDRQQQEAEQAQRDRVRKRLLRVPVVVGDIEVEKPATIQVKLTLEETKAIESVRQAIEGKNAGDVVRYLLGQL